VPRGADCDEGLEAALAGGREVEAVVLQDRHPPVRQLGDVAAQAAEGHRLLMRLPVHPVVGHPLEQSVGGGGLVVELGEVGVDHRQGSGLPRSVGEGTKEMVPQPRRRGGRR
jgi:hypothetical protein